MSQQDLSIRCPNRLPEIGKAAQLIEAFGAAHGLSPEVVFTLNLALDEVVTNIISYAYDDEAEHQIGIRVALERDGVSLRVEDDGRAFNPLDPDARSPAGPRRTADRRTWCAHRAVHDGRDRVSPRGRPQHLHHAETHGG